MNIRRRIEFFFQRIFRGFDDSDTWDMQDTFYRWLLPRLERFEKISIAYPINTTNNNWHKELKRRIAQLYSIIHVDEFDFSDRSYLPDKQYKELIKKYGKRASILNSLSYNYCVQDFNKWFSKNISKLWW